MSIQAPFNLYNWIEQNRHLLKPPVGNKQIYLNNKDFIVMIVGGPNSRKDYHYNLGEELFFQLEGNIVLRILENDKFRDIEIKEGEMFLLPPKIPHWPQRGADTVGLVIERYRKENEKDAFIWFCENCGNKLYEHQIYVSDIVAQLPVVMKSFYDNLHLRTCVKCGHVLEPPAGFK
jgi:3-hydroxyanthranilate 3,4-dioxygenase